MAKKRELLFIFSLFHPRDDFQFPHDQKKKNLEGENRRDLVALDNLDELDLEVKVGVRGDEATGAAGAVGEGGGAVEDGLLANGELEETYPKEIVVITEPFYFFFFFENKIPSSQHLITWPTPILVWKGWPRSTEESNLEPSLLSCKSNE